VSDVNIAEVVASQLKVAMNLVEALEPNILAAKSYKEKCEAQGFSEMASESMALDFHALMVRGQS
jgi:hypothetical protein